jgi:hypothetical protein
MRTFTKDFQTEITEVQRVALKNSVLFSCNHIVNGKKNSCHLVVRKADQNQICAEVFEIVSGISLLKRTVFIGPKGRIYA